MGGVAAMFHSFLVFVSLLILFLSNLCSRKLFCPTMGAGGGGGRIFHVSALFINLLYLFIKIIYIKRSNVSLIVRGKVTRPVSINQGL